MQVVERAVVPSDEMTLILGALNALKRGDASVRLPVEWAGVSGRVADVFNEVVERNQRMAHELERLSHVVGKEGKLGKRGSLGDVTGFWRDSIDAVNQLIDDLVHPTSETARVIGAVAQGDLSQTMALEVDGEPLQGEFLRAAKTVNKMVDQLGSFAAEVTRVAREVGTEGKLGGQATVKGVAGIWKDLTDSVNSMAGNLTAQVRNIADVTTAVATGDLSQEDRRRRQGRVPRAQEHDQHDGGPAALVRLRSDARGARSRHRRQARRPGARGRRVRYVEGPDRLRELDGVEPDRSGAQHRGRDQGRGVGRPFARRSPST